MIYVHDIGCRPAKQEEEEDGEFGVFSTMQKYRYPMLRLLYLVLGELKGSG